MLVVVSPVEGALYTCLESTGVRVITDSPAQLRRCTLLHTDQPTRLEDAAPVPDPLPNNVANPIVPQAQPAQTSPFSIPLERIGSLFVVTVQINGIRPAKMILDTGASHTILSHAVVRDLSLMTQPKVASVTLRTAGGTVQADVFPITSIRVGGAEVLNIHAVIHDLPEAPPDIEGLLGLNVLDRFTVTLDTVRNHLILGAHP